MYNVCIYYQIVNSYITINKYLYILNFLKKNYLYADELKKNGK